MKILFTHLYYARSGLGGAAVVVLNLARAMKERFHEEVMAAVNQGSLAEELKKLEVPVIEIPFSKFRTVETLWRLNQVFNTFRPELVHSHHRYLSFLLDSFFKNSAVCIHTEHVLKRDKPLLFRYGHVATAVGESIRQNLISHYGVPEDRAVTIHNAVLLGPVDRSKTEDLLRKCSREPGQMVAVCVGRLDEQKGHRYLIEAVSLMPVSYRKKIKILVAGEGRLGHQLKKEVISRGVGDSFIFLGFTKDISSLLSVSDFLILPSLWEGLPLSLLEACLAGKAAIATDIPGSREVVRGGRTGLLVAARDAQALCRAIQSFLDDPEKVKKMGEEARGLARGFSFERMVTNYHDLYKKMIGGTRP